MAASEKSSMEVFSVAKVNGVCPIPTIATFLNFYFLLSKKILAEHIKRAIIWQPLYDKGGIILGPA